MEPRSIERRLPPDNIPHVEPDLPHDRERLLTDADFPIINLSEEQEQVLQAASLHYVILDHNKPDQALQQAVATTTWQSAIPDTHLHYATNGGTYIGNEVGGVPIHTLRRENLANHLGVPDLIASSAKDILQTVSPEKLNTTWLIFSSADVLILHPQGFFDHFSRAMQKEASLVTSYCGGLGLFGMVRLWDYYFSSPATIRNTMFASGLMTEFFAIRADLAQNTIAHWNEDEHRFSYARLHQDPRVERFLAANQGTVEAHFRWMISQVLGDQFGNQLFLMHPPTSLLDRKHRIYPNEEGYTSAHDGQARAANIAMASTYNPELVSKIHSADYSVVVPSNSAS